MSSAEVVSATWSGGFWVGLRREVGVPGSVRVTVSRAFSSLASGNSALSGSNEASVPSLGPDGDNRNKMKLRTQRF